MQAAKAYGAGPVVVLDISDFRLKTTRLAKRGGKVVFIGLSAGDMVEYNVVEVSGKELDVLGIFRYANVYRKAIDMVAAGKIDLKTMVTHHFPLEKTQEALELADTKKDQTIKVVVNP